MHTDEALQKLKRAAKLQRLLQQGAVAKKKTLRPPLVRADRKNALPLSWAQQRLWFLDQLDAAASAAYHMPSALRLVGQLDVAMLQGTLDKIVARHEILRTTFSLDQGEPIQVIAPAGSGMQLEQHDLSAFSGQALECEIVRRCAEECTRPFDLRSGPLIRGQILRVSLDEHILLITQHHIISDGWSMSLLVQEVSTLYASLLRGHPDPLPPLDIQYADYAIWQRQWLQGDNLKRQIDFWKQQLAGSPALLTLPTDRQRPSVQSFAGASVPITLPASVTQGLNALNQKHGSTMFMVLLAGWAIVLSRLSGQDDVVIGTPVANRLHAEVEPLLGFFVNTLALRVRLDDDPTIGELLGQIKVSTLSAYEHQDLPFEQVVEALQPVRSMSHGPLFQAMLAMNNTPQRDELQLPGLRLQGIEYPLQTSHLDVTLSLNEVDGQLVGTLNYASALFDQATVERWCSYLSRVLQEMAFDTDLRISQIDMLGAEERQRVTIDYNANVAPYPDQALIHQLFEDRVRQSPDAVAVVYEDRQLSYAQLNRLANQVAHALLARGAQPDARVAICMHRGPEMVVAMLAVLKAGAAYVPLDPAYPVDRLKYMLEDSAPLALLTCSELRGNLPVAEDSVLLLDAAASAYEHYPDTNPDAFTFGFNSRQLAYVIYTSGSTGQPKGAMVEHRGLCNLIAAQIDAFALTPDSRVLQFVSFSFDVCISEIAMALCSGAALHLASATSLMPGAPLAETLQQQRITHLSLPLPALAAMPTNAVLNDLQTLIVGGDICPVGLARRWSQGRRFLNVYGPTEATVSATAYEYVAQRDGNLPIGTPLPNTRIYLLDSALQPVPLGAVGEIFIGGVGVARGYLGLPEHTAKSFLPDPFAIEPDARMYRTGDLARWLSDGNLDFAGRNDFQVKIRGFRIELGEIEARLAACEGVREAVVCAREDIPGDKRVVAYATAQPEAELSAPALRTALARDLPEYMLPSAFVLLERFPLTPNSKIDRKALPAPERNDLAVRPYAAPLGETERVLAETWQSLLGLERVGRHDHFFELGGHSLLAVQVVSRLRQVLGIELPLREIFAKPLLADLAVAIAMARPTTMDAIAHADRRRPLPLSWSQQRLWFLDQLDNAAGAAYHMPAAMLLRGALDVSVLRRTLDQIVARHEILRTHFALVDGDPVQIIEPSDNGFALTEVDLRARDAQAQMDAVKQMGEEEAIAPFDLQTGPLIRGRLLHLSGDEHVLLVTQHHIISDGWSIPILMREVGTLYSAFLDGQADPLPALPIQYADYAVWQRGWLRGAVLDSQIDFWKQHLTGAPDLLELPTDRLRPATQSHAGGTVRLQLSTGLVSSLKALNQRHGVTTFMTLLAGWSVVLSRLSGQNDLVVGASVANRQRAEIEPLLGFFVNTLALRMQLDDSMTVTDLLRQARIATLGAYEHQDVPFEQVVEALQPVRSMSHSPLFQVMLALNNNQQHEELALPGLSISGLPQQQEVSRFDLTLALCEAGDELYGSFTYASDLFDHDTVERWANHLLQVLADIVSDDDLPVRELTLLSDGEQQRLIDFNDAHRQFSETGLIHRLFEAQVRMQPDTPAVVCEGITLTYGELNRRANQLAHALISLGCGPDERVAICMERSVEMAVAILGVLKSGAGYVPTDPTSPAERLSHVLADSAPLAVITHTAAHSALPNTTVPVITLNDADDALAQQPTTNPDADAQGCHPRQLAYVIYTSGSTGVPKGVMVEHRSAVNFWNVMRETTHLPCPAQAKIALNASYTFDMSLKGWLQLLSGHTLHILPQYLRTDATGLCRYLAEHRIDAFDCTPSQLDLLLSAGLIDGADYCPRSALIGGEAISNTLWDRLRASTDTRFFNMYGPTEATVDATICEITSDSLTPNIGKPIANARIYVLDSSGMPAPLGIAGEIYIGGVGVARGYLKRPELTEERFLPDPFGNAPDAQMYRTGDLGRWRADGCIEYIGRNDFQVKIRGFRVELGEIEARLRTFAGVRDAVVVARDDNHGSHRLVAYVIPAGPTPPSIAELREHLASALAEFMVPSLYKMLDAFPINARGKLDRKALPSPDIDSVQTDTYEVPQGAIEKTVAGIWQELLELDRIGRNDDFFDLGGHSLLAIQLIAQVRQKLGVELGLRDLFSGPKLSDFAQSVATRTIRHPNLAPIRTSGSAAPLFFVHAGEGEVGYAHALARYIDNDVPVYGLAASGFLQDQVPHSTVGEMASSYIQAIREVQPTGPYRIAGWSSGGTTAYEIAHQLLAADEQVQFLGLLDTTAVYPALPAITTGATEVAAVVPDETAALLALLAATVPEELFEHLKTLAANNDDEGMLAYCQQAGELPQRVPVATLHRHARVRFAIASGARAYTPRPIPIPVHLFTARDQHRDDPLMGWEHIAGSLLRHRAVEGTHRSMVEGPHLATLGNLLSQTLQEAAVAARPSAESTYDPRIVIRSDAHGGSPLFCIPGAGSSVTVFADLAQAMPAGSVMHGLQPRGLCGTLLPHLDVPSAARAYIRAIRQTARGPYRLLGHSYGGGIACEIATQLEAAGERVSSVIALDTEPPRLNTTLRQQHTRVEGLLRLVELYEMTLGRSMQLGAADFEKLDETRQISLLLSRLIQTGIVPPRTRTQELRGIVRVFCANLNSDYAPAGSYAGRVHVALAADRDLEPARTQWREFAPNAMFWTAPGNHMTMLTDAHAGALARWLQPIISSP